MEKKPQLIFMPGFFDDFEGTQEELDEFVAEITRMIESGELAEKTVPVYLDSDEDDEIFDEPTDTDRTLH